MAATSVGKVRKLDAICARLKLTQKTTGSGDGVAIDLGSTSSFDFFGKQQKPKADKEGCNRVSWSNAANVEVIAGNGNEDNKLRSDVDSSFDPKEKNRVSKSAELELKIDENVREDVNGVALSKSSPNISNNNNSNIKDYNKEIPSPSMQDDSPNENTLCPQEQPSSSASNVESRTTNKPDIENHQEPVSSSISPETCSPLSPSQNSNASSSAQNSKEVLPSSQFAPSSSTPSSSLSSSPPPPLPSPSLKSPAQINDKISTGNSSLVVVGESTEEPSSSDCIQHNAIGVKAHQSGEASEVTPSTEKAKGESQRCGEELGISSDSRPEQSLNSKNASDKESSGCDTIEKDTNCCSPVKGEVKTISQGTPSNSKVLTPEGSSSEKAHLTPELKNEESFTTPHEPSESTPALSASGRRKSRKSAKPQRQIGGRYCSDANDNPQTNLFLVDGGAPTEEIQSYAESGSDQLGSRSTVDSNKVSSRKRRAPLNLSGASSDTTRMKSSFNHVKEGYTSLGQFIEHSIQNRDTGRSPDRLFSPTLKKKLEAADSNSSPENSSEDALADFASNTMSELLGIYGFEGSDTRNLALGKMFQRKLASVSVGNRSPLLPGVLDAKPAETIDHQGSDNPMDNGGPVKSGPFRKKVYRSLMHPNVGNGQNGLLIKAPSPPLPATVLAPNVKATPQGQDQGSPIPLRTGSNGGSVVGSSASKNGGSLGAKRQYAVKTFSSSDFHKYIRRYANGMDCGGEHCHDLGYRDHYHCLDCPTKVFIRKEEMVRHFKWHKKRHDSLQHGFMRYSPVDDCSKRFGSCTHNGRQTHYHCVQRGCDKVYISTSDVQMHANFHRKDSAIIQEGFQRFRATEDCGTTYCSFYGQRTTHFHCRRPHCNFTFKNKSDMEKHKSYHQKDEVLSKDGFKKFMKYEPCPFSGCRYSKASNHIHCIRPGCHYVLHSTAQLYSHKRKHERREFETAYQRYSQVKQQNISSSSSSSAASPLLSQDKAGAAGRDGTHPNFLLSEMLSKAPQLARAAPVGLTSLDGSIKAESNVPQNMTLVPNKVQNLISQNINAMPENMSALNLTIKREEKASFNEDGKNALPMPLIGRVKGNAIYEDEEAQDLSMHGKARDSNVKKERQQMGFMKSELIEINDDGSMENQENADKGNGDNFNNDRHGHDGEDDFDDFDDDDDDDDDDDKDYTQVEEPTLVDGFGGSADEDKLDSSPLSKEDFGMNGLKGNSGESDGDDVNDTPVFKKEEPDQTHSGVSMEMIHQLQASAQAMQKPQAISNVDGQIMAVRMPARLNPEKRDESWKKYLVRYTANDACFSRCECLYKDHYHCRDKTCQVTFKAKDGVRNHARYHELQDSIVPLVYFKFDEKTECKYENCSYNLKELHYHCNWTNCNHVIPHSSPTFTLLNHYRVHEFGVTFGSKAKSAVLSPQPNQVELDPLQKRRGRPPKYPKYDRPIIPKVHLTEKEILDSTLAFMHNKYTESSKIINGFKKFDGSEICVDKNCIFLGSRHFHCGRKFCHMSTDRLDFLNLHAKDFHNNITILDGYEFFDRVVDCRRPHCHNNRINRHFHCIRPRCDYSFVRHSTMSQHNKKHPTATTEVLLSSQTSAIPSQQSNNTNAPSRNSAKSNTPTSYIPIAPAVSKVKESSPIKTSTNSVANPITSAVKSKSPVTSSVDDSNSHDESTSAIESKTVIKSAGTFFPLSGIPNDKQFLKFPSQVITQQLVNTAMSLSHISTPQHSGPLMTSEMTVNNAIIQSPNSSSQGDRSALVSTTPSGAQVIKPAVVSMSIPANIVPTSIPILAQASQGQQPNILTGIVPVGKLAGHNQPLAATPQLLNIPRAQIIQTSQGQFLQTGVFGSTSMVQFIQNPVSVLNATATTGSGLALPTVVSSIGNAATAVPPNGQPLTILLHQPGQQPGVSSTTTTPTTASPPSWADLKKRMHYPIEANCGRPFCKLKKKDHYHCLDCNQAFSDQARLRVHIGKHGFKFKKSPQNVKTDDRSISPGFTYVQSQEADSAKRKRVSESPAPEDQEDTSESDKLSSSLNIQLSVFTDMVTKGKEDEEKELKSKSSPQTNEKITLVMSNVNSQWTIGKGENSGGNKLDAKLKNNDTVSVVNLDGSESDGDQPSLMIDDELDESNDESSLNDSSSSLTLCSSLSRKSGRKRSSVKNDDFVNSDTLVIPKAPKQRKLSGKWDSGLPAGYKRVRCGEDCGHIRCSYRQTVTHFHCLRDDCGYGFSDKSRIMQHSIRHERLDKLMGGEFQQYRASVSCQKKDCEINEKASHFHCLKCSFACTDSSKVPPHRKYHSKLENVRDNGFKKFSGTADCQTASCSYFRKQTHYHCLFPGCNYSVLGPSQMAPHKLKHS